MLKAHPFICLFFTALLVVVLITPLVRKLAWKVGAVDYPNKRRINRKPIPRMGGVGVFCALIVSLLLMVVGARYFGWPPVLIPSAGMPVNYYVLAVGVTIAFLTGVIDDIYHLKPLPKLAGQIIAASVASGKWACSWQYCQSFCRRRDHAGLGSLSRYGYLSGSLHEHHQSY